MPYPQPPTHRPLWLIVLSATMLVFGGVTLVHGLTTLRDPSALTRQALGNEARSPAAEEAVRKLEPMLKEIIDRHRTALHANAIAEIVFGLFTLYAVAAVLSRDRNGRRLALGTAVIGIIYEVAGLPLMVRVLEETVTAAGPLLAEVVAGPVAARSQAEQIASLRWSAAAVSVFFVALGIGWCVLLLVYFGGRRGRELYGIPLR
jgi:hypothetical protein